MTKTEMESVCVRARLKESERYRSAERGIEVD